MAATSAKYLQLVIFWIAFGACCGYDCRWTGAGCNGGTCNTQTGECTGCNETTPAREGYDCGLVTGDINSGTTCMNGGTSYGPGLCYCPEDFMGDTCEFPRHNSTVYPDRMEFVLNPLGDFSGSIYVEGGAGNQECEFLPGQWKTIQHTACGNVLNEGEIYTRRIIIQFDKAYVSGIDLLVTFNGNLTSYLVTWDTVSLSEAGVDLQQGEHSITGTFNPITWTRTTLDDQAVPDEPIDIGTIIVYTFSVPSIGYAGLKLESVSANNTLTGIDSESTQLIEDGCTQNIALVADGSPQGSSQPSETTVVFKLRVFQFSDSDTIALKFIFKVCIVEADCALSSCSGQSGRKRRSLDQDEVEVYTYLRVRGPGDSETSKTKSTARPFEANTKPEAVYDPNQLFILVITIESAVLTLFVVALIAFVVHWYRTKNRDTKYFHNKF